MPALAFPAEAGTHLPTPEGWKAELALGGWLVSYRNKCPHRELNPDTVAYLSTNWARRRLTLLIEANALTTSPDHSREVQSVPQDIGLLRTTAQSLLPH